MKYAKGDPMVRMLMRMRELDQEPGVMGPIATMSVSQDDEEVALMPMIVTLRTEQPPAALNHRHWYRITSSMWTVSLSLDDVDTLDETSDVASYERASVLSQELTASVERIGARLPKNEWIGGKPPGLGVIVGIIDDGIDWRHPDFVDENNNSRILYLLDQRLRWEEGDPKPEDAAATPPDGVEYEVGHLSKALTDDQYKVRHKFKPSNHGTHVAGIVAGNGRSVSTDPEIAAQHAGVAPAASIIFVAVDLSAMSEGLTHSQLVNNAISYIYRKAAARGMPCVINMSLGQNLGGHDGETSVERNIDEHLEVAGRAFVVAAGNEHKDPTHACGEMAEGKAAEVRFDIGPHHPKYLETQVEVWYSPFDEIEVVLRCPHGEMSPRFKQGEGDVVKSFSCVKAFVENRRFHDTNGDARIWINIARGALATGTWTIELHGTKVRNGSFDAWVERTAFIKGQRDQPKFSGKITDARWRKSVTTPATARRCICVGNFNAVTKAVTQESSRGSTRDGRVKPDVVAPGTEIVSARSSGDGSGESRVVKSGTSMAAPHVAGLIALMLQKNPDLSSWTIQRILAASSKRPEDESGSGWGVVNAREALKLTPERD